MLARAAAVAGPSFRAAVLAHVVSRELDVRQALAKAVLGEVDAAVVYRSDALSAGDAVRAFPLPPEVAVQATYQAAALARAPHPALARAFIDLLSSAAGRGRLAAAGFGLPGEATP